MEWYLSCGLFGLEGCLNLILLKMGKTFRIGLIIILGITLVAFRYFQNNLFYDPLISYFRTGHSTEPIPQFDVFWMYLNIFFRYFLNMIISLAIIWLVFQKKGIIKVSTFIYLVLFLILFVTYIFLIESAPDGSNNLIIFYVRRFLIQPLFLFILLPAFYFQRKK